MGISQSCRNAPKPFTACWIRTSDCRHECGHYAKLVGRQITVIIWDDLEGRVLPVLLLTGWDRDGNAAAVTVLTDPEGNGPGHLDHNL